MRNVNVFNHEFPVALEGNLATRNRTTHKSIFNVDYFKAGLAYPGKFVPDYSMHFRKVVNIHKAHYLYFKPDIKQMLLHVAHTDMNSYADIYYNLKFYTDSLGFYKFTTGGQDHHIIIGRQLIMDMKGKILFLGVSKGYQDTLQPEDRRVYIASEFYTDEIYKYFIKKFDAEYIDELRKEGVEIVSKPALAIEQEYFDQRAVKRFVTLDDFEHFKNELKQDASSMITNPYDDSVNIAQVAKNYDAMYPSPILPGYSSNNLKGEISATTQQDWNQGWERKFMYVIRNVEITWRYSRNSFEEFMEKMHTDYNPDSTRLRLSSQDGSMTYASEDFIPDFQALQYLPERQQFILQTNQGITRINLKCTHRNEYLLLQEEFGSLENVTFVNEETSTQESDEVSEVTQDEVTQVRLDDGTVMDVDGSDQYTVDSNGVRWRVTPYPPTRVSSDSEGTYVAGMDSYTEEDSPSLNTGIVEQIRQRGTMYSPEADAIRQYPISPDEAFRSDQNIDDAANVRFPIAGETYEDDEVEDASSNENLDEEEAPYGNEGEPDMSENTGELPSWASEDNFTHNT